MEKGIPDGDVDAMLALQLAVAWAGEARSDPPRLGWWQTDLVDDAGGGDLFARLTPRTQQWTKLDAVREAARRVDERARKRSATPDRLRSIFHLGFEIDEQLDRRLTILSQGERSPAEVFGAGWLVSTAFDKAGFEQALKGLGPAEFEEAPEGRAAVVNRDASALELLRHLAAALTPFPASYPLPHVTVKA